MGTTTIQVSEELADELAERKHRGDSYESVIWRLIETLEGPQASGRAASSDSDGEAIACEHCGYEWSTGSSAARPTCPSCSMKTDRQTPT